MSKKDEKGVLNTANSNSSTDQANANNAFGSTTKSINDYQDQLAKYVGSDPYSKGGQYDQTINAGLANASDAGANSLHGALQSQALRTGQNSAADAATAASAAQQNTRDLAAAGAQAQQQRIGSEANYNQGALQATAEPIGAYSGLYGTSLGGANNALGTAADVSKTPSFWDTVGSSFGSALGKAPFAAGGA